MFSYSLKRTVIPKMNEFCSGELFAKKMLVPCDTPHYLETVYGVEWKKPLEREYYFNWLNAGIWDLTSDEYRLYDSKGNYMEKKTREMLESMAKERNGD